MIARTVAPGPRFWAAASVDVRDDLAVFPTTTSDDTWL
jgi:hypothetical protein